MKAAVLHAYNEPMTIEEVTPRPVGEHEVRVEVNASGVCHSDVMVASGGVPFPTPVILGHEGAGVVLEVGAGVEALRKGDRVVATFAPACGHCFFCVNGKMNLCQLGAELGLAPKGLVGDGQDVTSLMGLGTFAEAMTVHESSLLKVETDLPAEQLALLGCGVTTGVGAALNTAQVTPGSTVVVVGCGGVGLSVIQGARLAGAARIFAVDPIAWKRETALAFGATDSIDPTAVDVQDEVKQATHGRGADFAFEVVGRAETLLTAFNAARPGGTVVLVGFAAVGVEAPIPLLQLMVEEKSLLGSNFGSTQMMRDLPRLITLVEAGRLDVESMITRRIALHDVNDAFKAMETGEVVRSVIV